MQFAICAGEARYRGGKKVSGMRRTKDDRARGNQKVTCHMCARPAPAPPGRLTRSVPLPPSSPSCRLAALLCSVCGRLRPALYTRYTRQAHSRLCAICALCLVPRRRACGPRLRRVR
eukprot:scaffold1650_cov124-Isochrysis_galbana.AAC.5